MSSLTACAAAERVQPFHRHSPVGQAIAVLILLAGAAWAIAWAMSAPPAFSDPRPVACVASPVVSSAQADTAAVRIRFADSAPAACGSAALGARV